jgi:hypothetical protein
MNEQTAQITRVNQRIAQHIIAFMRTHKEFHGDDLRTYVMARVGHVAPASPDRILRDLRQKNYVNYEVVSRSKSLYRSLPVEVYQPSLI